jgi:hypothetical protein
MNLFDFTEEYNLLLKQIFLQHIYTYDNTISFNEFCVFAYKQYIS